MLNEFAASDINEIRNPAPENFKSIKPETMKSQGEARNFWKEELDKQKDTADSKPDTNDNKAVKEYFDDNGEKYREGDNLLPNTKYEISGYKYETDDKGRIISAEGKLRVNDEIAGRSMEKVRDIEGQDYKPNDQQGHLIGHQFEGSDSLENMVPMRKELNLGDYKKLEMSLAKAVKEGADVRFKVEPVYRGGSTRPVEFRASYSINGEKGSQVFKN